MRRGAFYVSEFLFGGFAYGLVEVIFRGHTHPSMFVLGGGCFLLIGMLRRHRMPFAGKMVLSGAAVTAGELLCGLFVNGLLGLSVWDYSDMPWNLWGQVCPLYSFAWCLLSVPAMGADALFCRSTPGASVSGKAVLSGRKASRPASQTALSSSSISSGDIMRRTLYSR